MFFSLDVLRAHKGDCLILHYGSDDDPHLMLIDGGPAHTYEPELKPRLEAIRAGREIEDGEPLPVDVVMVSHIDDDHINGILQLTKEQRDKTADLRLDVTSLWYNSFDDLVSSTPGQLTAGTVTASVLAGADAKQEFGSVDVENEDQHQTLEVLSSVPQGRTLRDDAKALGWKPNHKFKGQLIMATAATSPVAMDGLTITVVGPMQPELLALQKQHDKWVKSHKDKIKKTPKEVLSAFTDASVPNLSSIVVLVECQKKTMLLTGDARGDKILEGLELVGLIKKPGGHLALNILKVPHHGSQNNMEPIFFERLPAKHYVFSGDGEHGNPERETLEMLLEARGTDPQYTIHLTYPIEEIDKERKKDWIKERTKEINRGKASPRPDWSPAKHSLTAFFAANPEMHDKVVIVAEDEPHLIDLLDEVEI